VLLADLFSATAAILAKPGVLVATLIARARLHPIVEDGCQVHAGRRFLASAQCT
jgi:hypothetical protein